MNTKINVLDFGADNTGIEDATVSFQSAIDSLKGSGGILIIPSGEYWIKGHIILSSNITIIGLKKPILYNRKEEGDDYVIFYGKSTTKGYDGGIHNVCIDNLILKGSFTDGKLKGASLTFHHAKNIQIRNCIFSEAIINGHGIDLLGCKGITISNCEFEGMHVLPKREYVEAIQLDHSTAESNGAMDTDYLGMDGLPTINVIVDNCIFRPLLLNNTYYPAPNPIGSHSRVIGMKIRNIQFINNLVIGGPNTANTTYCKGWLHFCWADNILIQNNIFISNNQEACTIISTPSFTTAYQVKDVHNPKAKKVDTKPEVTYKIAIYDNDFIGFTIDETEPIIDIAGKKYKKKLYKANNINICNNAFIDSIVNDKGYIKLSLIKDVENINNYVRDSREFIVSPYVDYN